MKAELIAVGSELLRFGRHDGNGDWLTERLNLEGVEVGARSRIEDDVDAIAGQIRTARERVQLVVLTGGLGPTEDDRTREGLARGLEVNLERDATQLELLVQWFEERGRPFRGEMQARQADRPAGSRFIQNPIGTAPGVRCSLPGCELFAVPGVPAEMQAMFEGAVLPWIREQKPSALATRAWKVAGRTESEVDSSLSGLHRSERMELTVLTGWEGIEIHARATGDRPLQLQADLDRLDEELSGRLKDDLYGRDGDSLASVVGRLLALRGESVATAESCTAGLLAASLTEVPGSSAWFLGGLIVYQDRLKIELAGVDAELLARHGAVSREVGEQLARGARQRCGATYGIGVTGIAGPTGGSPEKPVGLVHLGLDCERRTSHRELRVVGDRPLIRRRTVTASLDALRRRLTERAAGE